MHMQEYYIWRNQCNCILVKVKGRGKLSNPVFEFILKPWKMLEATLHCVSIQSEHFIENGTYDQCWFMDQCYANYDIIEGHKLTKGGYSTKIQHRPERYRCKVYLRASGYPLNPDLGYFVLKQCSIRYYPKIIMRSCSNTITYLIIMREWCIVHLYSNRGWTRCERESCWESKSTICDNYLSQWIRIYIVLKFVQDADHPIFASYLSISIHVHQIRRHSAIWPGPWDSWLLVLSCRYRSWA